MVGMAATGVSYGAPDVRPTWRITDAEAPGVPAVFIVRGFQKARFIRRTALSTGGDFVRIPVMNAMTNAVNITDGLDGLAAGSSALVFAAFVVISFTQFRHPSVYHLRDATIPALKAGSIDVTVVAAALMGACIGFLWWNAPPAKVFMGDTGALALGGAMAGMGLITNTALLLPIIGGLYVLETASVIAQVISFRGFGRRILRMSPIHHHFELLGWPESTIIVRFWILAGLAMALGLGLFYADFLRIPGVTG